MATRYTEAEAWHIVAQSFLRPHAEQFEEPPSCDGLCGTRGWLLDAGLITKVTNRAMKRRTAVYVTEGEFVYGNDDNITIRNARLGRAMGAMWMAYEADAEARQRTRHTRARMRATARRT